MYFSSTIFLFLFLPVLMLFYFLPVVSNSINYRNIVLLIFSILFYAWGEPVFVFLLLFSIIINYVLTLWMNDADSSKPKRRRFIFFLILFWDVLLLVVFKYSGFIVSNVASILQINIQFDTHLPIGISFFTFQIISYVIDVYRGNVKVQRNPIKMSLYVVLFPQLVAGPIVRYQTIEKELTGRTVDFASFSGGVRRFVYGLGKKVLLANYMAQIADNVFDYTPERSVGLAWVGAIVYTLQIYYDFSGYSDMAIGLGEMFGFHFPENFNYPYIAKSVTDFWRRWHISLSSWFKDYVYIPMGGNRCSRGRNLFNLFVVWLLTGIWHGAEWTFIVWGLFYFIVLVIERFFCGVTDNKQNGLITRLYTILVIIVAWVIFRSDDMLSAVNYIGQMFGIGAVSLFRGCAVTLQRTWILIIFAVVGVTPLWSCVLKKLTERYKTVIENLWMIAVFAFSFLVVIKGSYNPFIYFNF